MPRSRNTAYAALAFAVLPAVLAVAACGDAAKPAAGPASAGPATGPASAGPASAGPASAGPASAGLASAGPASAGLASADPASPAAGSASTGDGAGTATGEPAPATATAAAGSGAKKMCGAMKGVEDYKLVVAGSVSCAEGEKVLWAYFKQGSFVNQHGGAIELNGWSCIFSRTPHATVASSDGFSCWRDADTAQLLDPNDPQAGGSGPK